MIVSGRRLRPLNLGREVSITGIIITDHYLANSYFYEQINFDLNKVTIDRGLLFI